MGMCWAWLGGGWGGGGGVVVVAVGVVDLTRVSCLPCFWCCCG